MSSLSSIKKLVVSGTKVSDLTPLAGLSSLATLAVSKTQVSDLTPLVPRVREGWLVKWSSDYWEDPGIYVKDCPVTSPPPEIVKQSNEAILNYFGERALGEVDHLCEAKMLILGEGRSSARNEMSLSCTSGS